MSRAEKFIKSKIRIGSNTSSNGWRRKGVFIPSYSLPWLSPDDARKAVEIARKETFDKIWHWLAEHINDYVVEGKGKDIDLMFDDIKQAMKNE